LGKVDCSTNRKWAVEINYLSKRKKETEIPSYYHKINRHGKTYLCGNMAHGQITEERVSAFAHFQVCGHHMRNPRQVVMVQHDTFGRTGSSRLYQDNVVNYTDKCHFLRRKMYRVDNGATLINSHLLKTIFVDIVRCSVAQIHKLRPL